MVEILTLPHLSNIVMFLPFLRISIYFTTQNCYHLFAGVQGDQRTHSHVVALRAVTSSDGMTADWYPFEPAFLQHVSTKICNTVRGVNRVVYDVTSKPPGTIEWE